MKKTVASLALAAACCVIPAVAAVPASAAPLAAPAYSCTYDRLANVNANLLKVHTSPNGATVIGDFGGGQAVEFCASSGTTTGGYTWVYTTGKLTNGKTGTGWVAESYLTNIRRIS